MNGRQLADAGRAVRRELKVLFITAMPRMPWWATGISNRGCTS